MLKIQHLIVSNLQRIGYIQQPARGFMQAGLHRSAIIIYAKPSIGPGRTYTVGFFLLSCTFIF